MAMGMLKVLEDRVRRPLRVKQLQSSLENGPLELVRLGSPGCGWTVPVSVIQSGGTAFCVGAGEDISFDIELNKKGLHVITMDPTPRAGEHVAKVIQGAKSGAPVGLNNSTESPYDLNGFDTSRFKFIDVGLWDENSTQRFFAPKKREHVSHSITNLQRTNEWFEARCMTLKAVCAENNVRKIDLLKMDVEGAEYVILRNIIQYGPKPAVLCVEFDEIRSPIDPQLMDRILSTVELLTKAGYKFRHLETANALFVLEE